ERARPHAVVGGDAAHVDVVDALLLEHLEQRVAPIVQTVEGRVRGGVPALGHDRLDVLLADQVLDGRHEGGAGRAHHAVRRPRVDVVGGGGDVVRRVLVVVA